MNRRQFVLAAAALALRPAGAFATPVRTVALVTADLESHVVIVDLANGRVLRTIATVSSPRSIERVGAAALVAHSERGTVSVIDGRPLRVAHVLDEFDEPRYTAAHRDGRHAYVTDAERGELVVLDVVRGEIGRRLRVGAKARHLSLSRRAGRLWVALGSKAHEIAVVALTSPAEPRLVTTFRPHFLAHDVGFAPDGRHAWITSGDRDELAVYDLHTGRIVARPSGDWPPQHVTFSRTRAYVTSGWSGTLRMHHLDGRPIAELAVPVGSYNVQQEAGAVVTPSLGHGEVTILDTERLDARTVKVARSSHDACVISV